MTRDDILRMAREAWTLEFIPDSDVSKLERFATLVAAAERDQLAAEIEALRAEVERLRADLMESDEIRDKLSHLLTRTAAALKGDPPEGVWHSWHGLPERATQLMESLRKLEEQALRLPLRAQA